MPAVGACDAAPLDDLLELARGYPRQIVDAGAPLVVEGELLDTLFVLIDGALRSEKRGVPVASVTTPGSCVGEMSLLLGTAATADVFARERSEVAVIESASTICRG